MNLHFISPAQPMLYVSALTHMFVAEHEPSLRLDVVRSRHVAAGALQASLETVVFSAQANA
jgi:hypothetical protein